MSGISLQVSSVAYQYKAINVSTQPPNERVFSQSSDAIDWLKDSLPKAANAVSGTLAPELLEVTYKAPDNKSYIVGYVVRVLELLVSEA